MIFLENIMQQPNVWIVTEGLTGTENQCVGIAQAMGAQPIVKRISLNEPWKTLSPFLGLETQTTFKGNILEAPWPDILIASGRKSIAAARYIKKKSKRLTFAVQVQDPRSRYNDFDLIISPEHDPARGDNVFLTLGTPNKITAEKLQAAKNDFSSLFSTLPTPRVAVLIGGSTKSYTLDEKTMRRISYQLLSLSQKGYGLMVTSSRRTGKENIDILQNILKGSGTYIWDGQSENPYFGMLAWADTIIVTSDSMGMISEAATTGKPVYTVDLGVNNIRHQKMLKNFEARGILRPYLGRIETWDYKPLNDAQFAADEILRRWVEFRSKFSGKTQVL